MGFTCYQYMLPMKYFGNKVKIRKKRGKNVYELASKHFSLILHTNYFQMILLCRYPLTATPLPPPPQKKD